MTPSPRQPTNDNATDFQQHSRAAIWVRPWEHKQRRALRKRQERPTGTLWSKASLIRCTWSGRQSMEAAFVEEVAASLVREFLSKKVKVSLGDLLSACSASKKSNLLRTAHPSNNLFSPWSRQARTKATNLQAFRSFNRSKITVYKITPMTTFPTMHFEFPVTRDVKRRDGNWEQSQVFTFRGWTGFSNFYILKKCSIYYILSKY